MLAEVPGALRHDTNDSLPVVVLGQVELNVATNPSITDRTGILPSRCQHKLPLR